MALAALEHGGLPHGVPCERDAMAFTAGLRAIETVMPTRRAATRAERDLAAGPPSDALDWPQCRWRPQVPRRVRGSVCCVMEVCALARAANNTKR
jgi:hypothetical protein